MNLNDDKWLKWAIRDPKYGFAIGIRDDAPDWAKKEYAEYEAACLRGEH